MAALQVKENSTGQMVMQSPLLPSLGNIFSTLVWMAILAFFLLPSLGNGRVDWENVGLLLIFFVVTVGATLMSHLVSTRMIVDPTSRAIMINRQIFGLPISSTTIPFRELQNIEFQYYRQAQGRYSHDAWRVNAISNDGRRIPLNWDGKQDEMAALAQKLSERTGVQVLDSSTKPESVVRKLIQTIEGEPADAAPSPSTEAPSMPDNQAPPPVAIPPWFAPPTGPSVPQVELAPLEPAPVEPAMSSEATTSTAAPAQARNLSIPELEKRVAGDAMDAEGRFALARKYQAQGQLDRAITLYQETLRIDTANSDAQNDLGVAWLRKGKRAEAEAALRRAIALDPFSSRGHLNLGLVLRSMNRAAEASQEFYQARQNARGDAETRLAEAASTGAKMDLQLSNP
jgi:tetratricopeptide (TPR) repeat protein